MVLKPVKRLDQGEIFSSSLFVQIKVPFAVYYIVISLTDVQNVTILGLDQGGILLFAATSTCLFRVSDRFLGFEKK